jgi:excinuclease ABC subunit C
VRGRRAGPPLRARPCLDYYIKRCGAPCVGYVSKEEYREGIDGVIAFLSGRFRRSSATSSSGCTSRAGEQDYEQAALERNRCRPSGAARAPAGGDRGRRAPSTRSPSPSTGRRPTPRSSRSATACSSTASRSTSTTTGEQRAAIVAEEFLLQYYASALAIPSLIVVQQGSPRVRARRPGGALASAAAARSRSAPPSAAGKRRILELAERNARLALDQEKLKAERRRQQRVEALDGLQPALRLDALPVRIECFDISHVGGTHTVASMVVFEGGAPKKADYRRFTIRAVDGTTTSPR